MKWTIRVITKRNRKRALRVKASSIDELAEKLSRHARKLIDFEIETPVNDPNYWKSLILQKVFQRTHQGDTTPTLF
jgi:hypothetical protein